MMTPSQTQYRLTISPTIPTSYLPFCHPSRFLPPPPRKNPNLVSSFRQKPRLSPSVHCFASSSSPMATPTQSSETKPFSVLFVCLGNICRSPAAEGVFRDIVKKRGLDSKFVIDSAGTIDYHEGNMADPRMRSAAKRRGVEITSLSRPIKASDFREFDLILAMDEQNKEDILEAYNVWKARGNFPPDADKKVKLMCSYCKKHNDKVVPDPYYGGAQGFEKVLDLLEDACESLLDSITAEN
ncbi:Acid phosphatase [Hirschfeldia incana]|nr:Acid phosphatase [Hirschfeldia incana]